MRVDGRLAGWYLLCKRTYNPTRQRRRCHMRPLNQPIMGTRVESLHPFRSQVASVAVHHNPLVYVTASPASSEHPFRSSYDNVCRIAIRPANIQCAAAAPTQRRLHKGFIIYIITTILYCFEPCPCIEALQSFTTQFSNVAIIAVHKFISSILLFDYYRIIIFYQD